MILQPGALVPGLVLPSLTVTPTSRQLVLYAAAIGDFYEAHYDQEFARAHGLPGVIVHGLLKLAFLGRCVTQWAGPDCFVRQIQGSYRGVDLVNQPITVEGKVSEVTWEPGLVAVTVELVGRSADGRVSTPGSVTFDVPVPAGRP